ncbi:MAG: hypothetical protein H6R45_1165 [Proteobacteria bacterium]|nr:hypothetical protein [Pseudomonadota bacterium]
MLLCVGAALLVAAPSAGLAVGAIDGNSVRTALGSGLGPFTPASMDPRLAQLMGNSGKQMRFTPAGAANRTGRSITVAVRVDEDTARAISVRQVLAAAGDTEMGLAAPRIAATRYNLGLSRGYQSFARAPEISKNLSDAAIPDLAAFKPSPGAKDKPSRFNARIALEAEEKAGRDARTREALGDQMVDVGGSYSLTRNLDVTAGVRYSQDRDRLAPIEDGKQDSQAVYVGTQFRF